jgi:hypothetical protein
MMAKKMRLTGFHIWTSDYSSRHFYELDGQGKLVTTLPRNKRRCFGLFGGSGSGSELPSLDVDRVETESSSEPWSPAPEVVDWLGDDLFRESVVEVSGAECSLNCEEVFGSGSDRLNLSYFGGDEFGGLGVEELDYNFDVPPCEDFGFSFDFGF